MQEEQEKRASRASRFNTEPPAAYIYKPDDDIAAKTKRAEKWGVDYKPEEAVLMDMGEH